MAENIEQLVISLKDKEYELKQEISNLNRIIGAKEELVEELQDKVDTVKSEVHDKDRVMVETITDNPWSGFNKTVEFKNLDDVKSDIQSQLTKDLKYDKHKLENNILDLEIQIDDLSRSRNELEAKLLRKQDKKIKSLKENFEDEREGLNDVIKLRESEITELETELEKERNNKSDKELEEKRRKEIVDLRNQIALLKRKVAKLTEVSLWGKFKNMFKANDAEIQAEMLVKEAEAREKEIVRNTRNSNNSFPWFF